jgi:hypothetical protein
MAAATMKHAQLVDEVKALGGLVKDVTQRENETRRQVAAIDGRLAAVEIGMKSLDDTVTGMRPMLEKNTDLTFRTAQDVIATKSDIASIKGVVDQIGPDIGDLKRMIAGQQDRDAARRWWVAARKFLMSTGGFLVMIGSVFSVLGGGIWWLWTHFKLVAP